MSIAARAVSSRATSSPSLAGIAFAMPGTVALRAAEGERDEFGEAVFELGGDGGRHVARGAGTVAVGRTPVLEVGVLVVHAELHGDRVDERLEALGELKGDLVGAVTRLHGSGNVLPGDDAVARHQPPMNWASRATRSPGASRESSSCWMPRTASLTRISMCSPWLGPCQRAPSSSGKRPLNPRSTLRTVAPSVSGSSNSFRVAPSPPTNRVGQPTISTGTVVTRPPAVPSPAGTRPGCAGASRDRRMSWCG